MQCVLPINVMNIVKKGSFCIVENCSKSACFFGDLSSNNFIFSVGTR